MGTPHWWLDSHGLTAGGLSFDSAELTDTDDDDAQAWREYVADTDPTKALSVFYIVDITAASEFTVFFCNFCGLQVSCIAAARAHIVRRR